MPVDASALTNKFFHFRRADLSPVTLLLGGQCLGRRKTAGILRYVEDFSPEKRGKWR